MPSFIGLVVSVDISTKATASLDVNEVNELDALVAQAYGVDDSEITSMIEYITTGALVLTIPDDVSQENAIDDLTYALASSLGVTEDAITLSLDPQSGEALYSVSSTNYEDSATLLEVLESGEIIDLLSESSSLVDVTNVITNDDIVVEVNIIVNGDDVMVPLQQAENIVDALLDDHYNSHIEGSLELQFF